jgi:hypothetical protein
MTSKHQRELESVLTDLARRLNPSRSESALREAIVAHMTDSDLSAEGVPTWLVTMFDAVRDERATGWQDFPSDGDRTAAVAFLRGLPRVLAVELVDDVESLTIVFRPLELEASVSWEGSCYRVGDIDTAWE